MTNISLYETEQILEDILPKLLTKVYESEQRAVVLLGSPERVEDLNAKLWTFAQLAFLPHGSAADGHAEMQPVWLTDTEEKPNGAKVLVLGEGVKVSKKFMDQFDRCLDVVHGAAKERLDEYANMNYKVTCWKQNAQGAWIQAA
jgi:DNA polymerase-3 subunit chi